MFITAQELRTHGYHEEASKVIERSIASYNSNPTAELRHELAAAYYVAGQWDKSQELFESLTIEKPEKIEYWGYLGAIAARKGNIKEAERISKYLLNLDRPYLFGKDSYWMSRIAAVSGNNEEAVKLLREAISQGVYLCYYDFYSIPIYELMDFESLRDYPPFQELIKPKE